MRHFALNIGDWTAATAHLSDVEECVYLRLILAYYSRESPLPADVAECYRIARARSAATRAAVDTVLREFFDLGADGYRQARCDRVLDDWRSKSGGAKSAANLRWQRERDAERAQTQCETDANAMRTHMRSQCDGNAGIMPPITHNPEGATVRSASSLRSDASAPPHVPATRKPRVGRPAKTPANEAKSTPVWRAYATAYALRYGTEPVRNAKVSAMLCQLVERLGDDAPHVAASYLRSSRGLYVASRHAVDLLVRDAEGLRTDWATGQAVTDTQARQADRTATNGGTFGRLIGETERMDGTHG